MAAPLKWSEFQEILDLVKRDATKDKDVGLYRFLIFATLSGYRGLLAGDVLKMTWGDVYKATYPSFRGWLKRHPRKEDDILIEIAYRLAVKSLGENANSSNDYGMNLSIMPPLKSDGTKPMSIQSLNRLLKDVFLHYGKPVQMLSTHTFRKTYAKHIYEQKGKTTNALIQLSKELGHSSSSVTKKYIDINNG
ncbi:site-specific integrase [Hymenobacter lapidiphilus]|uniref:site-specific integrase n=1 Tax=Hymenobacter sp. CCM 8763 TaxID=2303334 RepID=UPI00167E7F5E|nr:site-specific integrase [Hymenobacter sp. CCM 8763]